MDPTLLAILIKDIIVPEVMAIIRAHRNASGQFPTDEQVIAAFQLDAERVKRVGQDFLDQTRTS